MLQIGISHPVGVFCWFRLVHFLPPVEINNGRSPELSYSNLSTHQPGQQQVASLFEFFIAIERDLLGGVFLHALDKDEANESDGNGDQAKIPDSHFEYRDYWRSLHPFLLKRVEASIEKT